MTALRAATSWSAVAMKVDQDVGTDHEGKFADIMALKGDGLRSIDVSAVSIACNAPIASFKDYARAIQLLPPRFSSAHPSDSDPSLPPPAHRMIIDWLKFAPALFLLLLPIGVFHRKKVRFRPISRDWTDHWSQILNLSLHWIDLGRAAFGGWLLVESLALSPGAAGFMRYSVLGTLGAVMSLAVTLQTFVCKQPDSANAPFMFVTGLLIGVFPPTIVGFPIALALTAAAGSRVPAAYFPLLALTLVGSGFLFDGGKTLIKLALGFSAVILPWLFSLMFSRELVLTYRAKRRDNPGEAPLPERR